MLCVKMFFNVISNEVFADILLGRHFDLFYPFVLGQGDLSLDAF